MEKMMSRQHQFPPQPAPRQFKLREFLGVDFTTHESEVNTRRSPDMVNLVSGSLGSMDKRFGTKIENDFTERIWLIHNDFFAYNDVYIPYVIVQAGVNLYYKYEGISWTIVNDYATSLPIELQERQTNLIPLPDVKSSGARSFKLIQNNWITDVNDLIMLRLNYSAPTLTILAENLKGTISLLQSSIFVKRPKTSVGRSPNGLTSTLFEEANVISNIRVNDFLSNGTDTIYVLDGTLGYVVGIQQMQSDGTFTNTLHDASNNAITYTVDTANKKITFSAVPHATYKTGVDNISVTFSSSSNIQTSFNGTSINNFNSIGYFGLNGQSDYLFMCNHNVESERNFERWGKIRLPIYFPQNSYSRLGSSRKIGYSLYGNNLVLHCEYSKNEPSIYLKTASLDSENETIFQNTPSKPMSGVIARNSFANLRDDPLWLSEYGVSALVTSNITNVQSVQDRGFYINQQLLQEPNLDKAYAFIFDNKYFICVNSKVYIADPRLKYTEKLAYSESFQYDWYYWEGLDIQNHFIYNNELYFGTTNGLLMKYKNESDLRPYQDEIIGTDSAWANATSYSKGNIVSYLTKYYICLKQHTSDTVLRNPLNTYYWNEIEKGTGVYYVPVLAYWTTPIMNMGDMTSLKTLKNLWVRLGKYAHMSARIYYSTQGVILEKYDGIFDFSDIDFSRFTFSTDTDPSVLVANRQQRKFNSIQFKVESRDSNPFSLLEIVGEFIFNGKFKG